MSVPDDRSPEVVAFGIVLARYRRRVPMTQEQLSWKSGVDRKFISRIENGRREPALGTILKLCDALEIPPADFIAAVSAEIRPT